MQILCVKIAFSDKKTPRFLQNPVGGFRVKSTIVLALVDVKTQTRAEADGADNRMIRRAVLVWHDANARGVFINENVVWTLMRT